ncbi:hypothetical protein [Pandoraea sp. NPDC090278]|uniref:hypothetical protein n=1 Tax=Pandoraea sp. NPDC090278 TaxID=3364391 RepID=UPI00383AFF47
MTLREPETTLNGLPGSSPTNARPSTDVPIEPAAVAENALIHVNAYVTPEEISPDAKNPSPF